MQSKDFTDFFEKTTRLDLLLVFYQTPASPVCHMASLVERCTLANMVKNSSNRREKVKLEPVADPFSAARWKFSWNNVPENYYYFYSNFFVSRTDPERVNFGLVLSKCNSFIEAWSDFLWKCCEFSHNLHFNYLIKIERVQPVLVFVILFFYLFWIVRIILLIKF